MNPKLFYTYASSRMKTKVRITSLTDEAGNLMTSLIQIRSTSNDLFSSVFTNIDQISMSKSDETVYELQSTEFSITPKIVKEWKMVVGSNPPVIIQ